MSIYPCTGQPEQPLRHPTPGYRVARRTPEGGGAAASSMLREPWATEKSFYLEGKWYQGRVEPHCDDHVGGVLRWHRGVTLYEPIDGQGEDLGTRVVTTREVDLSQPTPPAPPTPPTPTIEPSLIPQAAPFGTPTKVAVVAAVLGLTAGVAWYASRQSMRTS